MLQQHVVDTFRCSNVAKNLEKVLKNKHEADYRMYKDQSFFFQSLQFAVGNVADNKN